MHQAYEFAMCLENESNQELIKGGVGFITV